MRRIIALSQPSDLKGGTLVEFVNWNNVHQLYSEGKKIVYEDTKEEVKPEDFEKELKPKSFTISELLKGGG